MSEEVHGEIRTKLHQSRHNKHDSLTQVRYLQGKLPVSSLPPTAHRGKGPVLVACRISVSTEYDYFQIHLLLFKFSKQNENKVLLHKHHVVSVSSVYLSMTRRAPMTDAIPLGQTKTISTFPRQGWAIVTVTATCSSVSIPDGLRSAAETEEEREALFGLIRALVG